MEESNIEVPGKWVAFLFTLALLMTCVYIVPSPAGGQEGAPGSGAEVESIPQNQNVGEQRSRHWQHLVYAAHSGPIIRLALGEVEDRTQPSEASFQQMASAPIEVIKESLKSIIARTHRFDVEVPESRDVEKEDEGSPDKAKSAEYLISGLVTERELDDDRSQNNRSDQVVARAAILLRIADATTGQILFATEEQAEVDLWNAEKSAPMAALIDERDSAFRSAIEASVNKGVYRLVDWFQHRPWIARVSKVEGDRVYVNAGRNQGLDAGMVLRLLADRRPIIDSETGSILGLATQKQGSLIIIDVEDDVAIARILEECGGIKPGDRVQLQASGPEVS